MLKLHFVGDVFPANLPNHNGFGIAGKFKEHKGREWQKIISNYFKDSDCVIGNLESPLLYSDQDSHKKTFAGDELFANFLKDSGFHILSIANNHILEKGEKGFHSTVGILNKYGLKPVGINNNEDSVIEVVNKNGVSAGISAFNAIHDITNPSLYSDLTEENVINTLNRMKGLDFKILVFHWGNEYVHVPSLEQTKQAYKFIDAGADIIVGHHPHVIQPVERYKNGLIFYSIGNFLFDMTYAGNVRLGMMAEIYLEKQKVPEYNLHPIYISKDYTPVEYNKRIFKNKLMNYRSLYESWREDADDIYKRKYERLRLRTHIKQRFLMKKDLIISFYRLNNQGRIQSLGRLWRRLSRKRIK